MIPLEANTSLLSMIIVFVHSLQLNILIHVYVNYIYIKLSGPDDLAAEHLIHSQPSLIIHIKLLFSQIVSHGCVPDDFGRGIIVSLIKDRSSNLNVTSNYRPIFTYLRNLKSL